MSKAPPFYSLRVSLMTHRLIVVDERRPQKLPPRLSRSTPGNWRKTLAFRRRLTPKASKCMPNGCLASRHAISSKTLKQRPPQPVRTRSAHGLPARLSTRAGSLHSSAESLLLGALVCLIAPKLCCLCLGCAADCGRSPAHCGNRGGCCCAGCGVAFEEEAACC